jgi:hypothetical protein
VLDLLFPLRNVTKKFLIEKDRIFLNMSKISDYTCRRFSLGLLDNVGVIRVGSPSSLKPKGSRAIVLQWEVASKK